MVLCSQIVMAHAWIDIVINLSCLPLTIIAAMAYSPDDVSRRYSHFHVCRSGMLIALLSDLPHDEGTTPSSGSPGPLCCHREVVLESESGVGEAVDEVAVKIRACTPTGDRRRVQTPRSLTPMSLLSKHFSSTSI